MTLQVHGRSTAALLAALLGACTVGEPLVDVLPQFDGGADAECLPVPDCVEQQPPGLERWSEPEGAAKVDLHACGSDCDPAADAGEVGEGCEGTGDLDALRQLANGPRDCQALHFEIHGAPAQPVVLEGVSLSAVNLRIATDSPLQLELHAPELSDVWLSLAGPVALQVFAAERAESLRASARRTENGAPRLELERTDANDVWIGDADAPFEGEVAVVRSAWAMSRIDADDVQLESVTFRSGRLSAGSLMAADAELRDVLLEVGEAQLASCNLEDTLFERCEALTLLGTEVRGSHLAACDPGILRAYESQLAGCSIGGTVDAVHSTFTSVVFGVDDPTDLRTWGGTLASSRFCEQTRHHQASSGTISCSECGNTFARNEDACFAGSSPPGTVDNRCTAWEELAPCANPVARERPVMGGH